MDLNKYLGRDFVISVLSRNLLTYRNLHGSSINADNNIMVIKRIHAVMDNVIVLKEKGRLSVINQKSKVSQPFFVSVNWIFTVNFCGYQSFSLGCI